MGGILLLLIALLSFTTGLILDVVARKSRQQFELSLNLIREVNRPGSPDQSKGQTSQSDGQFRDPAR
jgi:hypothetical protein